MPDCCIPTLYYHWRNCFLFIPNSFGPRSCGDTSVKLQQRRKKKGRCSLGIPDTSFRGLRTRTARRVLRSTCVLKWVPAVARMLQMETQKVKVTTLWLSPPVPRGKPGWRRLSLESTQSWCQLHVGAPASSVNHRWFWLELNLAISGFHFAKKENLTSHQNPSSKPWVEYQLPSIGPIPASKPWSLLSSLFLTNLLSLFPTYQGPWILYFRIFLDSPVS